jgi:uncharacterized protein (DUF58 family)
VLLIILTRDAIALSKVSLQAERSVRAVLPHLAWSDVSVRLTNNQTQHLSLTIHDMHPASCKTQNLPIIEQLAAKSSLSVHYKCQPMERGNVQFSGVECQVTTALHLLARKLLIDTKSDVRVYPNYRGNQKSQLLSSKQFLDKLGIRRLPRQGEGGDFHQLREFRDGDSIRQIDWKATSRMRKPISREYAEERDQQIVFLLDCSMRMRHQDEHGSHMDDALNAIVLLGHIALQQGDSTGLYTFGGIERWIPPAKGQLAARRLVQGLYDIQPTLEMPDYQAAIENLAAKLKKRALIILISNLRNEDGDSALEALRRLNKKHLVLMVDLREADLDETLAIEPATPAQSLLWASAEHYALTRKRQHKLATARGTKLLDVTPQNLSANLITRYLAIKQMGQL